MILHKCTKNHDHPLIVCTPPLPLFCCGVWASYQIFKKGGGLTGPLFLEQVAGKEGGDFFQGGLQFFNKK